MSEEVFGGLRVPIVGFRSQLIPRMSRTVCSSHIPSQYDMGGYLQHCGTQIHCFEEIAGSVSLAQI